jgi:hypothetical protein
MNKLLILFLIVNLTGCAVRKVDAISVQDVPDDCLNKDLVIAVLTNQLNSPKNIIQDKDSYDYVSEQIKSKIWRLRYRCQPI